MPPITAHSRIVSLTVVFLVLLFSGSPLVGQKHPVDFRYAPAEYFSVICFPDDWQKSVVTNRGSLGYDFGCGPYAVPLTEVSIGMQEATLPVRRQSLADPRSPIVTTRLDTMGMVITLRAFALLPGSFPPLRPDIIDGKVWRIDGISGSIGWAHPDSSVDPAFRSAAWGTNRPLEYRVKVAPGSARRVALGLCEPYKRGPGARILRLHVEGAVDREVDPLAEGAKNQPLVYFFDGRDANNDGELDVEVHASEKGPDPNTYLNAFWVFPESSGVSADAVIHGAARTQAELFVDCGRDREQLAPAPRADAIIAIFAGRNFTPRITIHSSRSFTYESSTGLVLVDGRPYLASLPQALSGIRDGENFILTLPRESPKVELVVYDACAPGKESIEIPNLEREIQQTAAYWKKEFTGRYGRIVVPDSGIQFLLDASIRNLYQVRENVCGYLQFQPGPSVYRGLWVHDAVWSTEAALSLGDSAGVRQMLEAIFTYQQANGQVRVVEPHVMNRETPLTVFMACRYALATGQRDWLLSHWPRITAGMKWLRAEHEKTLGDPSSVTYGLFPPGFSDGGLGGLTAEYSGVYWSLIALRRSIEAANWIGKNENAQEWSQFYDELLASFGKACARDVRKDRHGNYYLPMKIADTSTTRPPQQAQWGVMEAAVEGVFDTREPLVQGTLAVLDSDLREGLPVGTGWLQDGLWPFCASIQAQVCLHGQNFSRANELLYAIANHASPVGTWVEEQQPATVGKRTGGDASDASASALFINQVRDMIAMERGNTIVALEGIPDNWLAPGSRLALNRVTTRRGLLTLQLRITRNGKSGVLSGSFAPSQRNSPRLVVSLVGLKRQGFKFSNGTRLPDVMIMEHDRPFEIIFVKGR
jgi:hypothetical protein